MRRRRRARLPGPLQGWGEGTGVLQRSPAAGQGAWKRHQRGAGPAPNIPPHQGTAAGLELQGREGPECQARGTWDRVQGELLRRAGRGRGAAGLGMRGA